MKIIFKKLVYSLLISGLALTGCSNGVSNSETQTQVTPEDRKKSFTEFSSAFAKLELPFNLPDNNTAEAKTELNKDYVRSLFTGIAFQPAFGEKDVPDLAENPDAAHYQPVGILQTDGFSALIIKKQDEGNYYYLSTFDADGQFIDGICVAFTEGTDGDKTERISVFNEDHSIHIRQTETIEGKADQNGQSAFFEIAADGKIQPLKDGIKQPV